VPRLEVDRYDGIASIDERIAGAAEPRRGIVPYYRRALPWIESTPIIAAAATMEDDFRAIPPIDHPAIRGDSLRSKQRSGTTGDRC
jgi:hypothetical protein